MIVGSFNMDSDYYLQFYFIFFSMPFYFTLLVLKVYSLLQGRRDVETILTMGIMEDVTIIPQPSSGATSILTLANCLSLYDLRIKWFNSIFKFFYWSYLINSLSYRRYTKINVGWNVQRNLTKKIQRNHFLIKKRHLIYSIW